MYKTMDADTFNNSFGVTITGYKYIPDGCRTADGTVLSDSCDVAWQVTNASNGYSKTFMAAYNVTDPSLTAQQHVQEAWKLVKDEVFDWALTVINISPLIGQAFVAI